MLVKDRLIAQLTFAILEQGAGHPSYDGRPIIHMDEGDSLDIDKLARDMLLWIEHGG